MAWLKAPEKTVLSRVLEWWAAVLWLDAVSFEFLHSLKCLYSCFVNVFSTDAASVAVRLNKQPVAALLRTCLVVFQNKLRLERVNKCLVFERSSGSDLNLITHRCRCERFCRLIFSVNNSQHYDQRLALISARCTAHFCSCEASGRRPEKENMQSPPAPTDEERKEESVGRTAGAADPPETLCCYSEDADTISMWLWTPHDAFRIEHRVLFLPGFHSVHWFSRSPWNKSSLFLLHSDDFLIVSENNLEFSLMPRRRSPKLNGWKSMN